jgi:hypothetical protein
MAWIGVGDAVKYIGKLDGDESGRDCSGEYTSRQGVACVRRTGSHDPWKNEHGHKWEREEDKNDANSVEVDPGVYPALGHQPCLLWWVQIAERTIQWPTMQKSPWRGTTNLRHR